MLTDIVSNPYSATVVFAVILLCLIWLSCNRQSAAGRPPGPSGLELFFGIISSRKFLAKILKRWSKKYGPLFRIKFATTNIIVINNSEIANEAFAKNDCFNDRPQSIALLSGGGVGLVMINRSSFQKEQRRFTLNTLREFGMGRSSLEPHVIDVVREVCETIDDMCRSNGTSQPFDIRLPVYQIPPRIISYIVFGHDVGKDDKSFQKILRLLMGLESDGTNESIVTLISAVPFLRKLPFFSGYWKLGEQFQSLFHEAILKEVQEHQKCNNFENRSDYIYCFLKEMDKLNQLEKPSNGDKAENTNGNTIEKASDEDCIKVSTDWKPLSSFHEKQLIASVRDLFVAGSETSSTSLVWITLFLCKYPDIQKKMREEIDDILGQSGLPSMALLDKLPFVWAVIQEVMRMRPIAPLSVPHLASRDAKLQGYNIPKGSIILTNIWAIHHDETIWSEPFKFLPGRHLDENGKFMKSPHHMIFNVGARSCLGVQLANMELFLTTVLLLQRFCFTLPPGVDPDIEGECGITLKSVPFDVIASRR